MHCVATTNTELESDWGVAAEAGQDNAEPSLSNKLAENYFKSVEW